MKKRAAARQLWELVSVGPATLRDFRRLGVATVPQLARCDARELYDRLGTIAAARQDPCVEDVFACATAQARNPNLPAARCKWWYWSRVRKARAAAGRAKKG